MRQVPTPPQAEGTPHSIDGGSPRLPKLLSVMAIVFPGVARPKRHHPGKPGLKPRPLVAIVDLNLTIDHKWVVAQEIGSEWGADAPRPIFPFLTCWSTNPDLKGGQVTAYRTTIGGIYSAFSPLQFPGNLPPPAEMIPETREIEFEPIYAADSLTLSHMKVFLMYLCTIFCCTFPYSLFKGYHLRVNTHCLLLIGNVILIWVYIPHLIDYNELSLYFTLTLSLPKVILLYHSIYNHSLSGNCFPERQPNTK
ncbi:hypothetical protein DSO57_1027068 [Entomophthora muscae]|uniref:Uncharacterized protein n=1 Tax=Entomophthora muscae TaxID=34485 RepID=A0ACC2TNV3_9FUNG|nr:hypothetical protein DSO57_1027068 [Entomophthora muscae]